jgi:hypothetical protein
MKRQPCVTTYRMLHHFLPNIQIFYEEHRGTL